MKKTIKKLHNKTIILPIAILAVAGMISLGAVSASAHMGKGGGRDEVVQELAQKLGVDEAKVQTAFEAIREEHQQEMQKLFDDRLTQAVTDGKITTDQKNAIITMHTEMAQKRDENRATFQSMTREERQATRQQEHDELEAWAEKQGIDLEYFFGPQGGHMGRRGSMMKWDN